MKTFTVLPKANRIVCVFTAVLPREELSLSPLPHFPRKSLSQVVDSIFLGNGSKPDFGYAVVSV